MRSSLGLCSLGGRTRRLAFSKRPGTIPITREVIGPHTVLDYAESMNTSAQPFGNLLRGWRERRRLSQLELAANAEISQRHLSFIESGRSAPSRKMVLRLAEWLGVPLRERNVMLVAAGHAPEYSERSLQDPELEAARRAVDRILKGHEPYPALAVDRHWTLLAANTPFGVLTAGLDAKWLEPPVNVLRICLHPEGLADRIGNFREWREHILSRLKRQVDASADAVLTELEDELRGYPVPPGAKAYRSQQHDELAGIAVPLELVTDNGVLSFISTITVFGTPVDISLSELAIESFFPADTDTAAAMQQLARENP